MAASSPTLSRTSIPASRPWRARAVAAACALATAGSFALLPAAGAVAAPKPSKAELKAQLKKLGKKVDGLIEQYNAKRVELAGARKAEKKAKTRLASAESAFAGAADRIGDIAGMRYQGSDTSLPTLMFGQGMGGAAVLTQMAAEEAAYLKDFATARDERKKAAQEATALTARIAEQADDVEKRRKEAEDLIDEIEKRLDKLIPTGVGRRGDGTWAPQLPTGAENITPRTRVMRDEIKERFELTSTIGCYRSGGGGEHPLGRACDFMLSTGGTMPSAARQSLGDAIALWAIKNGGKIGVKYVIWKQRIYTIGGSGWRGMSNRGSITQNHFDHVHISMH
ncbi:coiled-coil domain-containing protein [Spongiactinospora sp. 9N601]|uniref:coiled-coil domain-containing protein n=1 Tax=Spongiactinospora sp. 9N601 TaxID=3375149 RepID=UPI0037B2DCC3